MHHEEVVKEARARLACACMHVYVYIYRTLEQLHVDRVLTYEAVDDYGEPTLPRYVGIISSLG